MDRARENPDKRYGPGNPEFKVGQRVLVTFLGNRKGTVDAVKSGLTIGSRESYEVILDEPLSLGKNHDGSGGNDYRQSFDFDQITKLEE